MDILKCSYCDADATHVQRWHDPETDESFPYSLTCDKHCGFLELFDVEKGRKYIKECPDGPFTIEAFLHWVRRKCSYCDAEATHIESEIDPSSKEPFVYGHTCDKHVGFLPFLDPTLGREYIKEHPDGPFTADAANAWWYATTYPLPNPINRKCAYCADEATCYRFLPNYPKTDARVICGQTCDKHVGLLTILQWGIAEQYIAANPEGPLTLEAVERWWHAKNGCKG